MKTIINETQVGLLIRNGRIIRELGPGVYRTHKAFRNETLVAYARKQYTYLHLYLRTRDRAMVSIGMTIGVEVVDAKKLYTNGEEIQGLLTIVMTRLLEPLAAERGLDDIVTQSFDVDDAVMNDALAPYGLKATLLVRPAVQLSRQLQAAIDAQEVARQKAKAELEEARGRTAVLRHYANAAKLTGENPDVLRLLLGQKAKAINVAFDASRQKGVSDA